MLVHVDVRDSLAAKCGGEAMSTWTTFLRTATPFRLRKNKYTVHVCALLFLTFHFFPPFLFLRTTTMQQLEDAL